MIPKSIVRAHIIKAIEDIDVHGIQLERQSTGFDLFYKGKLYPPKLVLSIATKYNSGKELNPSEFSGGQETNNFLKSLGFQILVKRIDWSWKECYMAVWGYDQLDIDSLQVKSILYRDISELIGRSVKSVEYKLQNVSSFDPRPRLEKPITEAKNAQALLGKVFKWYWSNKHKAREMYEQYRSEFLFNLPSIEFEPKIDHVIENTIFIEEGASETSTFKRRKRSQKLLEEGRKYFKNIENDGLLRCKACGFIAPSTIDKEIVQLHHTKPIYDLTESGRNLNVVNAILELLPLCPTCHSLAHTSRPPLELEQIKTLRQS